MRPLTRSGRTDVPNRRSAQPGQVAESKVTLNARPQISNWLTRYRSLIHCRHPATRRVPGGPACQGGSQALEHLKASPSGEVITLHARNLSSNVLNPLTCECANVVKSDQVERCRTARTSANSCCPLQILTQDQPETHPTQTSDMYRQRGSATWCVAGPKLLWRRTLGAGLCEHGDEGGGGEEGAGGEVIEPGVCVVCSEVAGCDGAVGVTA